MIYFLLLLYMSTNAMAQNPEQLSQQNAFPDEIIAKLRKTESQIKHSAPEKHLFIQIGTVVSILKHSDQPNLYDFTVSYDDGRVVTITQKNDLNLKPNDIIKTETKDGISHILGKIY